MIGEGQTIWLAPKAISFTAVCDACLGDEHFPESYLNASVSGTLRLEARHGWATCRRGHEIRVERANRSLAGAIR